ncbi:MAG: hypothetical protein ACR2RE_21400 [Geminicoccaceae bacterium]
MNFSLRSIISATALCLSLIACAQISDPTVGKGPISLSSDVEAAFADYQALQKPRYFAVSADGNAYYYSYCDVSRCLRQVKTKVIQKCESFSNGVPCKIYGSQGKVVWTN